MFLTLLIFCVGSVCAAEPDNTTNDNINDYNTMRACIDRLEANDVNQTNMINELNTTVNNQAVKSDKDKLNAEINKLKDEKCSIYEKLLSSPKKEDYEQLKNDIADKDNKIKGLNTKIETLNNILNINKKDVYNSLKALSSTNTQNIKCGKYTFKLEDYLKIPLIKDGKKNVLKFKNDNGRLPNYVIIAGIKVYQNVYKKLYNL